MNFVTVARLDDVPVGQARVFAGDGVRVLLARVGGEIHAVQATCPHKGCDWDGAPLRGDVLSCPRCHHRYSARTGLNPLTTACHVNQSTAEYHYRNFPEGKADVFDVRVDGAAVAVATAPRPFRKVIVG
jgi:nitrite reductase/ring-hydroxylating ferredoxin subunit